MSDAAIYVDHVLDLIANKWFRADTIDWQDFRIRYLSLAAKASTSAEMHTIVDLILAELDDGHSHLIRPLALSTRATHRPPAPSGMVRQKVAYVDVPWFMPNDRLSPEDFAGRLQTIIAELDGHDPLGWVVDLRRNGGGNMWPMLAGLGPLLGNNPIGFFTAAKAFAWRYEDGTSFIDNHVRCRSAGEPYTLRAAEPKTAVLIGQGTASAGEAVCIAFTGRPHARSFGAPTAGQSTANESHALSDGAILALTASIMVDRLGRIYGHVIVPDVIVSPESADREHDATWVEAIAWINEIDNQ